MAPSDQTLSFTLTEDGPVVRAVLVIDGAPVLEFHRDRAPRISVRNIQTDEEKLLDMAQYWARHDIALSGNPGAVLDAYAESHEKEIASHVVKIRKALRRIAGAARNAHLARRARSRVP